jgi:hypothetical protein
MQPLIFRFGSKCAFSDSPNLFWMLNYPRICWTQEAEADKAIKLRRFIGKLAGHSITSSARELNVGGNSKPIICCKIFFA